MRPPETAVTEAWMRPSRFFYVSLVVAGSFAGPSVRPASAQVDAQAIQQQIDQLRRDFDDVKQQYGDRLAALESSLTALQGASAGAPGAAVATAAQTPQGAEGAGGPSG